MNIMQKWKKTLYIIISIILLFVMFLYVFGKIGRLVCNTPGEREFWHKKVKVVFGDVKAGFTKEQVLEAARAHNWPNNLIDVQDTEVGLFTPFEFPASNWIIIFHFSDGKLAYAKVRREAGPNSPYRPEGAPEDITPSRTSPE
jgi:hypothetical protein